MGFSLNKRAKSFHHAVNGIALVVRSQPNAWIHLVATIGVGVAGFIAHLSISEWCLVALAIAAVWTAEMLNTAIELVTDLISPELHPGAGKAKDVAAGAVLLCAIGSAVVGALIFVPKIALWIRS